MLFRSNKISPLFSLRRHDTQSGSIRCALLVLTHCLAINTLTNQLHATENVQIQYKDRKSVVWGKSVDLGGRRIMKKKNKKRL